MLNKEYATTIFDGVKLSEMTIDQLRTQESRLTNEIIKSNNSLDYFTSLQCVNSCKILSDALDVSEQSLDIIKSEITARYAEMQVFV